MASQTTEYSRHVPNAAMSAEIPHHEAEPRAVADTPEFRHHIASDTQHGISCIRATRRTTPRETTVYPGVSWISTLAPPLGLGAVFITVLWIVPVFPRWVAVLFGCLFLLGTTFIAFMTYRYTLNAKTIFVHDRASRTIRVGDTPIDTRDIDALELLKFSVLAKDTHEGEEVMFEAFGYRETRRSKGSEYSYTVHARLLAYLKSRPGEAVTLIKNAQNQDDIGQALAAELGVPFTTRDLGRIRRETSDRSI